MNSARLVELRRQRELIREHLAWLDREIATAAAVEPPPIAVPPAAADALTEQAAAALRTAETYQPDPANSAVQARRGCLALVFAFLAIGVLTLAIIYFVRYRDRGLLFVTKPEAETRPSPAAAPARPSK